MTISGVGGCSSVANAGGVFIAGFTQGSLADGNQGGFDAWIARYGCGADVTGDGVVGVEDLVEVVLAWGPCGVPCAADVDGDGVVGVNDLVEVILGWGPCA